MAEAIHKLGARAIDEMLVEIRQRTGHEDLVAQIAASYAAIDPEVLRAVGGDRFPPRPLWLLRGQ